MRILINHNGKTCKVVHDKYRY